MNAITALSYLALILGIISCISCSPLHQHQLPALSVEERKLVEECYYDIRWKFTLEHTCYLITNSSLVTDSHSVANMRVLYRDYVDNEKNDRVLVNYCFEHQDDVPEYMMDLHGNAMYMPCEGITSDINQDWTSRRDTNKRSYFVQLTNEAVVKSYKKMRQRLQSNTSEQTTTMDPDQLAIQ